MYVSALIIQKVEEKYADDVEKSLYDSYNAEMSEYSHLNSYLDYRVLDEKWR